VRTLADLAQPGLRVGLSNADQATLGFMTKAILKSMNLYDSVMKNVITQQPTADVLVNQMRVGSLDAIVVYKVNVLPLAEYFDFVNLPSDKAKAMQPFAVRADSSNRQLSNRLLAYLKAHKSSFEEVGFTWKGDSAPVASDKLDIPDYLRQK
jgi:ABC-type molybdate transport system substrate-binding protein